MEESDPIDVWCIYISNAALQTAIIVQVYPKFIKKPGPCLYLREASPVYVYALCHTLRIKEIRHQAITASLDTGIVLLVSSGRLVPVPSRTLIVEVLADRVHAAHLVGSF